MIFVIYTWGALFITFFWRMLKRVYLLMSIRSLPEWPLDIPFVSIVIPCYNHGQYVDEAVQSVLEQTLQDFEIIIVNDGSTDGETVGILSALEWPKTRVIHLPQNMGLPAARNIGIRESQGKYICCLDADDKLQATYLEKATAMMESNSGISFVGSWTQVFGSESRVWYANQFDPDQILYANQFNSLAVFRRTAWEGAGGFFEDMREGFEDWEFWVRLTGLGYRGYQIPEKLIHVRRVGHSFALRAAEKKDVLVEKIKAHNLHLYSNPRAAIRKIKKSYRDVYTFRPFASLQNRSYNLPGSATMIISNLNSTGTMEWIRLHPPTSPLVWVARRALDEAAIDALYEATPYVYVLPNFLPRYARREAIHHLRKIGRISSIRTLKSPSHGPTRVGVDLADR
jgi:glycosyltransferase involved in cell wall biosynthesis